MNSSQTIGRSHSRKHYHEQSMDDFMKNIKKYNLRSQRHISPKPLLYMYGKNNTTNAMQKSRSKSPSNRKSPHSKSKRSKKEKEKDREKQKQKQKKQKNKTMKTKLQKIFKDNIDTATIQQIENNPAIFIQKCGEKIKKAQKYLQGKSFVGKYLCQEFLNILNQLVQKMVNQLNKQLKQIQSKTQKQIQRNYTSKIEKLQKKNEKMNDFILKLTQKAENNSKLLYEIRKMCEIDVDYIFGKTLLGTDKCGGIGYSYNESIGQAQANNNLQHIDGTENIRQFERKEQTHLRTNDQKLDRQQNQFANQYFQQQEVPQESGRIRRPFEWQKLAHDEKQKFPRYHEEHLEEKQPDEDEDKQKFCFRMERNST